MSRTRLPSRLVARFRLDSPIGPLVAAATDDGLALLDFDADGLDGVPEDPSQRWLVMAAAELARYWHDGRSRFGVPLDLQGTPFQIAVWHALLTIPPGITSSYSELAARAGVARAVRAVGAACGANPVAVVVPCHRVIGRDGRLTGYAGGLPRKQALLAHESAQQALS